MNYVHPELRRWRDSRIYKEKFSSYDYNYETKFPNNNNTGFLVNQDASSATNHTINTTNNNNIMVSNPPPPSSAATINLQNDDNTSPVSLLLFSTPQTAASILQQRESFLKNQLETQRLRHNELGRSVDNLRQKLAVMEKELETSDHKLKRRDESVMAIEENMAMLTSDNGGARRSNNSGGNEKDISWAPSVVPTMKILESIVSRIKSDFFGLSSEIFAKNILVTSNYVDSASRSFESCLDAYGTFLQRHHHLVTTSKQKRVERVLSPAFHLVESSQKHSTSDASTPSVLASSARIEFKPAKTLTRQRSRENDDNENHHDDDNIDNHNKNNSSQFDENDGLWCELELCTRYHLVIKPSTTSDIANSNTSKEIAWSVCCRDFSCHLHHHYEIVRNFSLALDLLCLLIDQACFVNDENNTSRNDIHEILSYVCVRFSEAKVFYENVDVSHAQQQQQQASINVVDSASTSSFNDDNNNPHIIQMVNNWVLEIANDIYKHSWLAAKNVKSDNGFSLRQTIRQQMNNNTQNNNVVVENIIRALLCENRETTKNKNSTKEQSPVFNDYQQLLVKMKKLHESGNSQPDEVFFVSCELFSQLLRSYQHSNKNPDDDVAQEEEVSRAALKQSLQDSLQSALHAATLLTSKEIMKQPQGNNNTQEEKLLSTRLFKIQRKLMKLVAEAMLVFENDSSDNSVSVSLFDSIPQQNAKNRHLLPLDPLSRWNLTVLNSAIKIYKSLFVSKSSCSFSSILLQKFYSMVQIPGAVLNLENFFDLNSQAFVLQFKFQMNNQQQEDETKLANLYRSCESLILEAKQFIFFSPSLTAVMFPCEVILKDIEFAMAMSVEQLHSICFSSSSPLQKKANNNNNNTNMLLDFFGKTLSSGINFVDNEQDKKFLQQIVKYYLVENPSIEQSRLHLRIFHHLVEIIPTANPSIGAVSAAVATATITTTNFFRPDLRRQKELHIICWFLSTWFHVSSDWDHTSSNTHNTNKKSNNIEGDSTSQKSMANNNNSKYLEYSYSKPILEMEQTICRQLLFVYYQIFCVDRESDATAPTYHELGQNLLRILESEQEELLSHFGKHKENSIHLFENSDSIFLWKILSLFSEGFEIAGRLSPSAMYDRNDEVKKPASGKINNNAKSSPMLSPKSTKKESGTSEKRSFFSELLEKLGLKPF